MVKSGCHVNGSIAHSPRKPKAKPTYEIVCDREGRDDEADAQADMRVVEVTQPGVDSEARWLEKAGKPVFGYMCPWGINNTPSSTAMAWLSPLKPPRPTDMTANPWSTSLTRQALGRESGSTPTRRIAARNTRMP